jgi:hypothetical protein
MDVSLAWFGGRVSRNLGGWLAPAQNQAARRAILGSGFALRPAKAAGSIQSGAAA